MRGFIVPLCITIKKLETTLIYVEFDMGGRKKCPIYTMINSIVLVNELNQYEST